MKQKWIAALLGLFAYVAVAAQKPIPENLMGKWVSIDNNGSESGIEFINSDSVILFFNDEVKFVSQVHIDDSKNPYWFDFTIGQGAEAIQVKSLLVFMNKDLVKWQVFSNESTEEEIDARPVHFTQSKGEILYLKRKK